MKKDLSKLTLNKNVISKLQQRTVKGGNPFLTWSCTCYESLEIECPIAP